MAFPRKGSRVITVGGVRYRYIGAIYQYDERADAHELRVQRATEPGRGVRATVGFDKLRAEYRRVGHHISRFVDRVPPYVVARAIELALARGWDPGSDGEAVDLGRIDDVIDWTGLVRQRPTR